jgi:hypothetical protein
MMIRAIAQVGNFVSMVINGKWWRIKKKYLNLSLDKKDRSKKGKRA